MLEKYISPANHEKLQQNEDYNQLESTKKEKYNSRKLQSRQDNTLGDDQLNL